MTQFDKAEFLRRTGNDQSLDTHPAWLKDLGDGTYIMVKRLLFHWTLIRGDTHDYIGFSDRWCYETFSGAMMAFAEFPENPAADYEPTGWHRHPKTGRRRTGGDPAREYIDY